MSPAEPRAIMDASALIAWLRQERGAATVERFLPVSAIVAVNLAETYEQLGHSEPEVLVEVTEDLLSIGLTLLPFDPRDAEFVPLVRAAGRRAAGGRGGLSLGGCCCLAVAVSRRLPVITDDGLWSALDLGVPVHLFR